MSIGYNVRTNNLTSPPSYRCEAVAASIVDEEDVAALINVYNPSITAALASTVLDALRAVVKQELLAGRSVNLTNFISFVNTLPVKLLLPTDPLPDGKLNVSAKVSTTLKTEMKQEATFTRLGYPVKSPTIISSWDTNTDEVGWIRPGSPYKIAGVDIQFDPADATQGIWVRQYDSGAFLDTKQTNIALNTPSSVIFVPDFTLSEYNDVRILVRTKYTANGELREGIGKSRSTNQELALFRVEELSTVASYAAYTGTPTQDEVIFIAEYAPDNKVYISIGYLNGTMGAKVEITANGAYDIPGLGTDLVVTVSNLETFKTQLLSAGRYIKDVTVIQATP
jgi:hypothetical protein